MSYVIVCIHIKSKRHNWEKTCKHALFLFLNITPSQPLSHSRCLVQVYWLLSWTGKHNLVNWTRAMTSKSGIHLSFIEVYAMCMDDHLWDDPHKFQIVPPLKGNRYTWWLGEKNTVRGSIQAQQRKEALMSPSRELSEVTGNQSDWASL